MICILILLTGCAFPPLIYWCRTGLLKPSQGSEVNEDPLHTFSPLFLTYQPPQQCNTRTGRGSKQ